MLNEEQVKKVAHLARLELSGEEVAQFTTQLGSILDYFQQLEELNVTDVPPTTRAIESSNITRADQLHPWAERENILAIAPEQDGDFFRVPKIISTED
uniref:Aspartyl/glutamyl-tRNA(Asn/Gln) amidotransferase subunit C n=1 Tax=Cyanothece sp. (strain PCC 7425 / ATCC 29141) TaxID=395961 RepID=GATC_CYAP4|nr:RecName: Full=Aspartyl/glutamyl-tRNA(Asn/Gln) amidotransferase subunit C; Short=Asp/Glu-ADT subunit C [Cyanothece sp. PCC 7425]